MSDERRLERVEEKVDIVKDQVSELRADFKVHSAKVSDKMEVFEQHITGDEKIITHIQPLLERLPDIHEAVEEFRFEKKLKQQAAERRKKITWALGSASLILGIIAGITKLF